MNEKRNANVIIGNAGGNSGSNSKNYKISLPSEWINSLGITSDNREVELTFDGKSITIIQKQSFEDYLNKTIELGHKILKLNYYYNDFLCTEIFADYDNKTVKFRNYSDDILYRAFGVKNNVTWKQYEEFLESRCVPKSRSNLRNYLDTLEIDEYNPIEIIKKTKGRMAEDCQWIEVNEL